MSQSDDLVYVLHAHTLTKQTDEAPLSDTVPENPVDSFFERAAFTAAGGPENWSPDSSLAKSTIANRLGFVGAFGSAAGLAKSVRTEERTVGSDRWQYQYDASGELVSARVTNADSGPLHKAIDFSDIDADEKLYAERLKKEWGVDDPVPLEI